MTEPTPQRERSSRDERPVMGDHLDLETDEVQRRKPVRKRSQFPSLVIAGIIALVLVVIMVILLLI